MLGTDVPVGGADTGPGLLLRSSSGRIGFWSPEMEQRYGFPAGKAHGQLSHELLKMASWQTRDEIEAALAAQNTWSGGLILHRMDGRAVLAANRWHILAGSAGTDLLVAEFHSDIVPAGGGMGLADIMTTVTQELSQPLAALSAYLNGLQKGLLDPQCNRAHLQTGVEQALKAVRRGGDILNRIRLMGENLRDPRLRELHARLSATVHRTTVLNEMARSSVQRSQTLQSIGILQRLLQQRWIAGADGRVEATLRQLLTEQERQLATY